MAAGVHHSHFNQAANLGHKLKLVKKDDQARKVANSNGFCGSRRNGTQMTQIDMIDPDLNYFMFFSGLNCYIISYYH